MKKTLASLLLICTATSFSFAKSSLCPINYVLKRCADAGDRSYNIEGCIRHLKFLRIALNSSGASPDVVKRHMEACFYVCKTAISDKDKAYRIVDKYIPCDE